VGDSGPRNSDKQAQEPDACPPCSQCSLLFWSDEHLTSFNSRCGPSEAAPVKIALPRANYMSTLDVSHVQKDMSGDSRLCWIEAAVQSRHTRKFVASVLHFICCSQMVALT